MSSDDCNSERHRDSQFVEQITALLGTDELIPMALKNWKDSMGQLEFVQASHDVDTNYNPTPDLVEVLFDLLPSIRAMRRTYCSRSVETENLEDNGTTALVHQPADLRSVGNTTTQTFNGEEPIFDESYVVSANLKFEKVDVIFQKLDRTTKSERSSYISRLQSEKDGLDRFHDDRRRQVDVDAAKLGVVFEKQKELVERLGEKYVLSK